MKVWNSLLVFLLVFMFGCGKPQTSDPVFEKKQTSDPVQKVVQADQAEKDKAAQTAQEKNPAFKPFYVYSDKGSRENHYVPSGFMPDGQCLSFSDRWTEDCYSGDTCIKIDYDVECSRKGAQWAGVYWLNPANNWGNRKGGFNLQGATKLTFWAKGDQGGEQINEVTIGGINGDYPDSDIAVIGPIILMPEWKKYTIDLRGKDLSYISGGFSWTTSEEVNADKCTFYLDDIRFE